MFKVQKKGGFVLGHFTHRIEFGPSCALKAEVFGEEFYFTLLRLFSDKHL